jgi:hypothetical protein
MRVVDATPPPARSVFRRNSYHTDEGESEEVRRELAGEEATENEAGEIGEFWSISSLSLKIQRSVSFVGMRLFA